MVDEYIAILMDARQSILSVRGMNPLSSEVANQLTDLINMLAYEEDEN